MPQEFSRTLRVAEQVKREIAPLIQRQLANGLVGMVTITGVDMSPDLRQAKIYISCLGGSVDTVVAALNRSRGHLRHHLAYHLRLKVIPRLSFFHDTSLERGARLEALLSSLRDGKTS